MPEHIRALIVILVLATAVFAFARAPVCAMAVSQADFVRRRNLWFAITLVAFLSGNFWIYALLTALLLLLSTQGESSRLAMYFAVFLAVPPVAAKISGLGLIEHLFALNHLRLLALTLLLPALLSLVTRPDRLKFGRVWPDRFLLAYLVVSFSVMLLTTTFTNVIRHGVFYAFIDVFLPYYVASRSIRSLAAFRDVISAFLLSAAVASAIAVFEMGKGWLLYAALVGALDVSWGYSQYLARAYFGVRAQVTTGQSIALGYVLCVALLLAIYARSLVPYPTWRRLLLALLAAGLFASLSRGPWLGAVLGIMTFVATGSGAAKLLARYAAGALVLLPIMRELPGFRDVIDLLPIIGSAESANVDYRRRLIDVALDAVWERPWFGGIDIYEVEGNESLRQHYGTFIDLVNTYIGILLGSGFVGLSLFLGFFLTVCAGLWRAIRRTALGQEEQLLGRALFASVIATMFVIFTVSSITVIPTVYWSLAGLSVAFANCVAPALRGAAARSGYAPAARRPA
jgi:O-antigen ligase